MKKLIIEFFISIQTEIIYISINAIYKSNHKKGVILKNNQDSSSSFNNSSFISIATSKLDINLDFYFCYTVLFQPYAIASNSPTI